MSKNLKIILFIIAAILFLVKCIGGCNDETTTTTDSDNHQETDYSWVYGTWTLTNNGETHTISFAKNGVYIESYQGCFGKSSDTGCFTIQSGRIKCDSGDGYPSYINIDGKRLTSDGMYYRKR